MSDEIINCTDNSEVTAEIATTQQSKEPRRKWSDDEINTIKNTVAKGATDDELKMFLSLASAYGLDPFAHEIWFVKMGDKNTIITARDGYLKIAQNSPHFLGLESDVVYAGDKFLKDKDGIHHSYTLSNRGAIVGAYAMVYRDDRKVPSYFFAPFSNYTKRGGVWQQYPHAMIVKVAEAMALKRAFALLRKKSALKAIRKFYPRKKNNSDKKTAKMQFLGFGIYILLFVGINLTRKMP